MKLKKKRIIILLIIIINLIIMFYMNLKHNNSDKQPNNTTEVNINSDEYIPEETKNKYLSNKKIIPQNFNFFIREYVGEIEEESIYSDIYTIVYEVIPKIYNDTEGFNSENIKDYYLNNTNYFKEKSGIEDVETFERFVNHIQSGKCQIGDFVKCIFNISEMNNDGEYTNLGLEVVYKEYTLYCNISICNTVDSSKAQIKITLKE